MTYYELHRLIQTAAVIRGALSMDIVYLTGVGGPFVEMCGYRVTVFWPEQLPHAPDELERVIREILREHSDEDVSFKHYSARLIGGE